MWASGITLALAALVLQFRNRAVARTLALATVTGTFIVAAAAIRVGHAGGQLVYQYNAGAAYVLNHGFSREHRVPPQETARPSGSAPMS